MMARFEINNERLKKLWDDGHSVTAIKTEFGCHENTIRYRLKLMGLGNREREAGVENNRGKRPMGHQPTERFAAKPAKRPLPAQADQPTQHIAAVRMPSSAIEDRPDWPQISAAIDKARGSTVALGQVAARLRLPYGVVKGLAQRVAG
jgi:hypothetical protein